MTSPEGTRPPAAGLRLLILTQAVDRNDPVLGFFHAWITEFSCHAAEISVICLKEGVHDLPKNVRVLSLGKESGPSRIKYLARFFRNIWVLRGEYDAVLVHMNEEYVILGGLLWRMLGKKIVMWRNHKMGSWKTNLAISLAHKVCHTSGQAYVTRSKKAIIMPIGIDTAEFAFKSERTDARSVLFFGRLDKVKKPDLFIDALQKMRAENTQVHATICGEPTFPNDSFGAEVKKKGEALVKDGTLTFKPAIRNTEAPSLYSSSAVYVNLTPSGSFDKTIGEAMACGCLVVTANDSVREAIPAALFVEPLDMDTSARAISAALAMSAEERLKVQQKARDYIQREHSLALLSERLIQVLKTRV